MIYFDISWLIPSVEVLVTGCLTQFPGRSGNWGARSHSNPGAQYPMVMVDGQLGSMTHDPHSEPTGKFCGTGSFLGPFVKYVRLKM